jgi:poly [ADP-ribose] polymerase
MNATTKVKTTMLVLVDTKANSNKFYRLELDANGQLTTTYGRVGNAGVSNTDMSGEAGYQRMLAAKTKKGYRPVDVANDVAVAQPRVQQMHLSTVAKAGLTTGMAKTNTVIDDLINRIVQVNAHQILEQSGGLIQVDLGGRVRTPLGLITTNSIAQASGVLDRIETVGAGDLSSLLEQYLTFVPQKVGSRAGWADTFFNNHNTVQSQRDFLTQLRDSVTFFDAQAATAAATPGDAAVDAGFKYKLRPVADDGAVFERIRKFYQGSKNDRHASSSMNLKRVFELVDPVGAKAYKAIAAEIGNEQQMWHGTKAANVLSILRKGLFIPPTSGGTVQTTGRMFGDGVYMSNQSTKSLNYAGNWGHSLEKNAFMLVADVAMGSEYRPSQNGRSFGQGAAIQREARTTKNKFDKPWNSINVKAGTAGVLNHEAIVWNLDQVRLRYIAEFAR